MSMDTEHGAEYSGILSRKKIEHGLFEDPYKPKVKAWIGKTMMYIRPLAPDKTPVPGTLPEKMDLTIWKIGEREEKGKFSLIHPGGASIKLRADSQTEADTWINQITAGIKRAKDLENQATVNRLIAEKSLRQQKEEASAKANEDAAREKAEKARREQEKAAKEKSDREAKEKADREAAERKQAELEQQRVAKEVQDALRAAQAAQAAQAAKTAPAQERATPEKSTQEMIPAKTTVTPAKDQSPAQTAAPSSQTKSPMTQLSPASSLTRSASTPSKDAKLVIVHLKEAQHLPQRVGGGACDVYAVGMMAEKQVFQTKVISNEYSARWNEEFTVDVANSQEVVVEIFDRNPQEKDGKALIGSVRIPLVSFSKAPEVSLPVIGKDGAAVRGKDMQIAMLSYAVVDPQKRHPDGTTTVASTPPSLFAKDAKGVSANPNSPAATAATGTTVKVLVDEVDHLPKMDILGTCDAYAVASVGKFQSFRTKVKWNSYYARWNEEFEFSLSNPDGETLLVELFDKDKSGGDDFIGSVQIPLLSREYSRSADGIVKKLPVLDKKGTGVRGNDNLITMLTVVIRPSTFSASSQATASPATASQATASPAGATPHTAQGTVVKTDEPDAPKDEEEEANFRLFGPGAAAKQSGEVAPFKDPVNLELKLQMDMVPGAQMEAFKAGVLADLAHAAHVSPKELQVTAVRAGSVIVDVALASDAKDASGKGAREIANSLEAQAKDPSSALLQGKYTCKTVSLKVKGAASASQDAAAAAAAPEDGAKVPNHAQKMAAKLYAENSELTGRLKQLTEKLQSAVGGEPGGGVGGESPAKTAEALLDEVLKKLEAEKHARDQAEAAFDLATADAMKHEAEKEEAVIDRDFLKSELQRQKEAHDKEMEAMQILTEQLAATEERLSDVEKEREALAAEIRKLAEEADRVKTSASGNASAVEEKAKEIAALQAELKEQMAKREEAVVALQAAQKEIQEVAAQMEGAQKGLKAEQDKIHKLEAHAALQRDHIKTLEETIKAQEELASPQGEIEELQAQLSEAKAQEESLRQRLQEVESRAKEDKERWGQRVEALEEELAKAKPEQSLLQADCERLRTALSAEQRAKLELEERVHKLQGRLVGLQGDLDAARTERRELETLVATLREEILDRDAPRKERERELAREALAPRNLNLGSTAPVPRTPGGPSSATRPYAGGSPAAHLFMAGTLSGTPGKVAKILLGSSERHRLATSDYLASLLENTVEINRVGKGLVPEDMAEIAAYVLGHPKIERMFLSGNSLGPGGAKQLADLLCRDGLRLQRLDLRHNSLGNQGCLLIMESLKINDSLTRLDLSANGLTPAAANCIAAAMRTSRSLVRLDLRHNELGDPGAAELADALKGGGSALLHLDVSANAIGLKGAEALALALQVNGTLEVLDIRGNALGATGAKLLEHAREVSTVANRQVLLPVSSR